MDYRVQRLKEDLTNAQQRNKKQRIQLSNYKKVHERDLEIIKKYKEVIDKAIEYVEEKQKIQYKFALSHIECDDLLQILEDKEVSE